MIPISLPCARGLNHLHLLVRIHKYTLPGGPCMAIKIMAKPNGPYLVTGDLSQLEVTDINGNKYDITGKQTVALAGCGGSVTKPFCTDIHSKIAFQAAEAALKSAG